MHLARSPPISRKSHRVRSESFRSSADAKITAPQQSQNEETDKASDEGLRDEVCVFGAPVSGGAVIVEGKRKNAGKARTGEKLEASDVKSTMQTKGQAAKGSVTDRMDEKTMPKQPRNYEPGEQSGNGPMTSVKLGVPMANATIQLWAGKGEWGHPSSTGPWHDCRIPTGRYKLCN